jgi:G3E family GTPase
VIAVTGVDPDAMATVMVGLLWDLAGAVTVQHRIDPERQVLLRVVSDMTGELDREEFPLEHACVSCALREDVIPTLERLARDGRWRTVVACLPVGAEAVQVGHVVAADTRLARHLRLSSVVAALDGGSVVEDLLGDDLLRERARHTGPDDSRGVGEVACAMVEYADVVTLTTGADQAAIDLVKALARPDTLVVESSEHLAAELLVENRHDYERTREWTATILDAQLPDPRSTRVWRLDLSSPRPFHPARLLDQIDRLGTGRHRSRGCFWLPTRPGTALVWDGAGGQLSIGAGPGWGPQAPRTRLVMTGVGAAPEKLLRAFDELLLRPNEALLDQSVWAVVEDGFEPWLGPIRHVA